MRDVLRAGADIADGRTTRGVEARRRLDELGLLSPAGVELALGSYLETSASERELDELVACVETAPRAHVLLSANVCTAALRALALATAAAPEVHVRPSRRDPIVADMLIDALANTATLGSYERVDVLVPRSGDAVHLYGSDETLRTVTEALPAGVSVWAHGTGYGLAVVGSNARLDVCAEGLARDVIVFDQAGCLSPRVVLAEGDAARAESLARCLDDAMTKLGETIPRGELSDETAAAITRYEHTLQTIGATWVGTHHVVGLDVAPRAFVLPPPARVVHVAAVDAASVGRLLADHARYVTVVGASGDGPVARAVAVLAPHARRAALGQMQRPPLDGPVDRRPTASA